MGTATLLNRETPLDSSETSLDVAAKHQVAAAAAAMREEQPAAAPIVMAVSWGGATVIRPDGKQQAYKTLELFQEADALERTEADAREMERMNKQLELSEASALRKHRLHEEMEASLDFGDIHSSSFSVPEPLGIHHAEPIVPIAECSETDYDHSESNSGGDYLGRGRDNDNDDVDNKRDFWKTPYAKNKTKSSSASSSSPRSPSSSSNGGGFSDSIRQGNNSFDMYYNAFVKGNPKAAAQLETQGSCSGSSNNNDESLLNFSKNSSFRLDNSSFRLDNTSFRLDNSSFRLPHQQQQQESFRLSNNQQQETSFRLSNNQQETSFRLSNNQQESFRLPHQQQEASFRLLPQQESFRGGGGGDNMENSISILSLPPRARATGRIPPQQESSFRLEHQHHGTRPPTQQDSFRGGGRPPMQQDSFRGGGRPPVQQDSFRLNDNMENSISILSLPPRARNTGRIPPQQESSFRLDGRQHGAMQQDGSFRLDGRQQQNGDNMENSISILSLPPRGRNGRVPPQDSFRLDGGGGQQQPAAQREGGGGGVARENNSFSLLNLARGGGGSFRMPSFRKNKSKRDNKLEGAENADAAAKQPTHNTEGGVEVDC